MSLQLLNNRYKILKLIGTGSFGVHIYKAKDIISNTIVALKRIPISKTPGAFNEAETEISVHRKLNSYHPDPSLSKRCHYITHLLDNFKTAHGTYLVFEYCANGDLFEVLKRNEFNKFFASVNEFMSQLLMALDYAHRKGVFHRDLKPENILIADDGSLRLADFGLATTRRHRSSEREIGTFKYMAPEIIGPNSVANKVDAAKLDVWAAGIVLLNVLFRTNPFEVAAPKHCRNYRDFVEDPLSLFDVFPGLSMQGYDYIVRRCLVIDASRRSLIPSLLAALPSVSYWTVDEETSYEYDPETEFEEESISTYSQTTAIGDWESTTSITKNISQWNAFNFRTSAPLQNYVNEAYDYDDDDESGLLDSIMKLTVTPNIAVC